MRRVKWDDFYVGENPATGFGKRVTGPDTTGAALQFPAFTRHFSGVSASLGVAWQVSNHIGIKANVGRGYRAPNITEIASNGLDPGAHIIYMGNRSFSPEFSLQEDLGISATFRDVSGEVSLFNNNIQNFIYLTLLADASGNAITDAQGNKTYQYQQAAAQVYGLEAWIALHPQQWQGFKVNSSLALVNGTNKNKSYKKQGIEGEYLPLIPPVKWVNTIAQKIQTRSKVITSLTPKMETEWNAAQHRFLGLNNTEAFTPGYLLVNAGLATEIQYSPHAAMQLMFGINNVFNTAYQSHLSRLKYFEYYSQSPNGRMGIYNMGRNMIVKLVMPF